MFSALHWFKPSLSFLIESPIPPNSISACSKSLNQCKAENINQNNSIHEIRNELNNQNNSIHEIRN